MISGSGIRETRTENTTRGSPQQPVRAIASASARRKEEESKSARTLTDRFTGDKKLVSSVKRSLLLSTFRILSSTFVPRVQPVDRRSFCFYRTALMLRILIQFNVPLPSIKNFVLWFDLYVYIYAYTFRVYFHRLIKDRGLNIQVRWKKIVIVYFGQHFTSID